MSTPSPKYLVVDTMLDKVYLTDRFELVQAVIPCGEYYVIDLNNWEWLTTDKDGNSINWDIRVV